MSLNAVHSTDQYLLIPGSLKTKSINKQLLHIISEQLTKDGIAHTTVNLSNYLLPDFNEEAVNPASIEIMTKFHTVIAKSRALIISSPEYNRSIPGFFKNIIDWLSIIRYVQRDAQHCFYKKPIFLASCSPSPFGGAFGLYHFKDILTILDGYVYNKIFALSTPSSELKINEEQRKLLFSSITTFHEYVNLIIK